MPAIVLQNEKAEQVGVLLVAGKASLETGDAERHCLFTSVPVSEALLDDPLCDFVQTRRNEEFMARIEIASDGVSVRVETPDDWTAVLQLPSGKWGVVHPTDGEVWGTCALGAAP